MLEDVVTDGLAGLTRATLARVGEVRLEGDPVSWNAVDQFSKKATTVELPPAKVLKDGEVGEQIHP